MGSSKRQRQKAARADRLAAEREAMARATRRRRFGFFGIVALIGLGVVVAIVFAATGDDEPDLQVVTDDLPVDPDEAPVDTSITDESTDPPAEAAALPEPVEPTCPPEDGSGPQILQFTGPPPMCIGEVDVLTATVETTAGTMVWELDAALDPASVNNFVFLARHHYYDGATFHRVIDSFVIQGGDPVGQPRGTGGPGYTFDGGFPTDPYEIGDIAMANVGSDPSNNGSQFFVITGPNGAALGPTFSPLGRVADEESLAVAQSIQSVPTDGDDAPLDDVVIESITIDPA